MNRKIYLTFFLFIILSILCGCEEPVDLKAPTPETPPSRAGLRHELDIGKIEAESSRPVSETPVSDLKVGFILSGKIGDYGFSYSQNQGLLALRHEFGMDSMVIEDVAEDESSALAIQQLIDNGCRIIFTPSYGFSEYAVQMADKYPNVYFFSFAGQEIRPNLSQYFGRMYQVRYLTGLVAGLRTQSGHIGYVAAQRIPQVLRGLDAFALGVKAANPTAKVHLVWSGSWNAPAKERELTIRLIKGGCDVIAQHQNSVAPQIAAEEMGVWSIGYHAPMGFFAPNAYLTGASWDWAPYMVAQVRKIHNGVWKAENYWGGLDDGVVRLDPLTGAVAPGTREMVEEKTRAIENGYEVFIGPIYDNTGRLRVKSGHRLSDAEMLSIDWLADNVMELGAAQ